MTAEVIRTLGEPGVLVHGINTRPGKPTILGVCNGKAVIGLPGRKVTTLDQTLSGEEVLPNFEFPLRLLR